MASFLQSPLAQMIAYAATVLGGIAAAIQLAAWTLDLFKRPASPGTIANYADRLHKVFYFVMGAVSISLAALFLLSWSLFPVVLFIFGETDLANWIAWSGYGLTVTVAVVRIMPREMQIATAEKIQAANLRFFLGIMMVLVGFLLFSWKKHIVLSWKEDLALGVVLSMTFFWLGAQFLFFLFNLGKERWESE